MKANQMPERHEIEIEDVIPYTTWVWDCPNCGAENELEVDPKGGGTLTCSDCHQEIEIIESK